MTTKTFQLKDLAMIRGGLVLMRKQAEVTGKKKVHRYSALNLKSVTDDIRIDPETLAVYDAAENLDERYLTAVNDIVVRLSQPYTAVLITNETKGLVFSSNFVVLRIKEDETLLPEYLFWLLNTPEIKRDIQRNSAKNMLGAIRSSYYSDLTVSLPPIERQRKIGAYYLLARRELALLRDMARDKERYYNLRLHSFAQKALERSKS